MLRVFARRSDNVHYFTEDAAHEIEGLRAGGPGWWLRGDGDAHDPRDVADVLQSTERAAVRGYDLVIAAPRPISILLALDPDHAPGVVDAHRSSVRAAVGYLEEHALVVRDRRDGADRDERGRWRSIVAFTHGINRHGEPHLHDHVLVGARPEGARVVLDSRALYAHSSAADAIYRSSMRHELAARSPWAAWRSFEGIEHVVGLDEGYRALWGGHHPERGEKRHWRREDAVQAWRRDLERFEAHGVVSAPSRRVTLDEHAFAGALEGRTDVARRHVVEAWANAATYGQNPTGLRRSIGDLYPELAGPGGVREPTMPVRDARMTKRVRELGPRPIDGRDVGPWSQRSRELPRSRDGRSR